MIILEHTGAILRRFEIEPSPLDRIVDGYFKEHREINSRSRRQISEISFGVMRWLSRLDLWTEACGIKKTSWSQRAACFALWQGVSGVDGYDEFAFLRKDYPVDFDDDSLFEKNPAAYHSYPKFLYSKFVKDYGKDDAFGLAEALNSRSRPTVRLDTRRISRDEAISRIRKMGLDATPTAVSPYGISFSERFSVGEIDLYRDGLIEIQDEGSQLASLLAAGDGPLRILDACAGAGGKSLMLHTVCGEGSRILASDVDERKLSELRKRATRCGAQNIQTMPADKLLVEEDMHRTFDVVLLDAPCSGTGTFKRSPDLKWRITKETICDRVALQREILERYEAFLKPGGKLVFITCSVLKDENEGMISWFLEKFPYKAVDPSACFQSRGIPFQSLFDQNGVFFTHPGRGSWDAFKACVLTTR